MSHTISSVMLLYNGITTISSVYVLDIERIVWARDFSMTNGT